MRDCYDPCYNSCNCCEPCCCCEPRCDFRPVPIPPLPPIPGPRPVIRPISYLITQNVAGLAVPAAAVNQPIIFTQTVSQSGLGIGFTPSSSIISLREPGVYVVMYNITYNYNILGTTTPATINTVLTLNGTNIIGGRSNTTLPVNETATLNGSTLIAVPQATMMNPTNLQLNVLTNQPVNYSNASLSIYKLNQF